ncbi:hypothetical protein [Bosea sp. ASV33]|uniref:hypothetical protein n=1 Tax=Bosea sp. ASV33 TaxID=2795106 RepID=UPI0018EA4309|nr:hypothetical protein [Bosea sp. ASV33]
MKVIVAATHCYPGCRVRIEERGQNPSALVEFSDGTIVLGELDTTDGVTLLTVPSYRTARGTRIEIKTWRLEPGSGAGCWRIKARVTTG